MNNKERSKIERTHSCVLSRFICRKLAVFPTLRIAYYSSGGSKTASAILSDGQGPVKMTVAQALVEIICKEGVTTAFGIPGAAINPVYKYLEHAPIQHFTMRHEEACVHAADGYQRAKHEKGELKAPLKALILLYLRYAGSNQSTMAL